ncbi:MAG: NAD(+)/NADH kinase [Ignavibacteria bacterium]
MTIGIIPNISKENIGRVTAFFAQKLKEHGFNFIFSAKTRQIYDELPPQLKHCRFIDTEDLFDSCDLIASIGGDGTMLHTAFFARESKTPIFGINFGKLGFLAEFDMNSIDNSLEEIKNGEYQIEERMLLEGDLSISGSNKLYAANDIVIDKGGWPKMIELSLMVNNDYVTTFAADGLILATPTGSTGYSLSAGGPIVSPEASVITISPISPHSLTMRPLVLSSDKIISIKISSHHKNIQINCDGQRVSSYPPPLDISVYKSGKIIRLIHTNSTNYFKILREKLFWGLDARRIQ